MKFFGQQITSLKKKKKDEIEKVAQRICHNKIPEGSVSQSKAKEAE